MRTTTIVSRVITDCKDYMHATRWQRLVDLSSAALNGQALALTQLALGSASQTTLRHRVKAVDRLLGSASFAAEHLDIYRTLAARWLGEMLGQARCSSSWTGPACRQTCTGTGCALPWSWKDARSRFTKKSIRDGVWQLMLSISAFWNVWPVSCRCR